MTAPGREPPDLRKEHANRLMPGQLLILVQDGAASSPHASGGDGLIQLLARLASRSDLRAAGFLYRGPAADGRFQMAPLAATAGRVAWPANAAGEQSAASPFAFADEWLEGGDALLAEAPAIVLHLVQGPAPVFGSPSALDSLRSLQHRRRLRLFHVHLLAGPMGAPAVRFPAAPPADPLGRCLFESASELPAAGEGAAVGGGRAMVLRGRAADLAEALAVVERTIAAWPAPPPPPPPPSTPSSPRIAWTFSAPQGARAAARGRPVILEDQSLILISGAVLARIDSQGEVVWSWSAPSRQPLAGSPALGSDGVVRVHGQDGRLYFLDAASGRETARPAKVGPPLAHATPLLDEASNSYICRYEGGLARVDADGRTSARPYFDSLQRFDCTGVIRDGALFVGCDDQCLHKILLTPGGGQEAWGGNQGLTRGAIHGEVGVLPGGALVVASRDDCLYGFDADGAQLWKTPLPGRMLGSPAIAGDSWLYAAISRVERERSPGGELFCLDAHRMDDHPVRWSLRFPAAIESTPALDGSVVYFGDDSGMVHAIGPTGEEQWREPIGAAVRSRGVVVGDNVVFGQEDGCWVALSRSP